jgi:hypothetical protein
MQNFQIFIAIALVIAAVAFVYTSRKSRPKASRPQSAKTSRPKASAHLTIDAQRLMVITKELRARNAQWGEIIAAMNPSGDSKALQLLTEIRGPHMFVPHTALGVIEAGCRAVKPQASAVEALEAALRGMNKVVRYGN